MKVISATSEEKETSAQATAVASVGDINVTVNIPPPSVVVSVPSGEIEATLVLAIVAAESLHGEAQVRLDAGHAFDADRRICVIDARSEVGRDLNRLFIGFVQREFGEDAFQVERVDPTAPAVGSQRGDR